MSADRPTASGLPGWSYAVAGLIGVLASAGAVVAGEVALGPKGERAGDFRLVGSTGPATPSIRC